MALNFKLADLFVQFVAKGVDGVTASCDKVLEKLTQIKSGMDTVGKFAAIGFATATASIGGFVRAGMAGSAMGAQLSFQMAALSRNIAGLFGPEIQKATGYVRELVEWMRSLTEEQRANMVRWLEAGAAAALTAIILPRVVGALQTVITAVRALSVAVAAGLTMSGVGALLPLIGALVSGFAALAVGTEVGRNGFGRLWEGIQRVGESIMGFIGPLIDAVGSRLVEMAAVAQSAAEPILEAFGRLWDALAPFRAVVFDIAAVLADVFVSAFKAAVVVVEALLVALKPLASFLSGVAQVIWTVVAPAFKLLAWLIEKVAKGIAWITGSKINLDAKVPSTDGPRTAPKAGGRAELSPAASGFESPEAAYARIAQASVQIGKRTDEKQLDAQQEGNGLLRQIHLAVSRQQAAIVR